MKNILFIFSILIIFSGCTENPKSINKVDASELPSDHPDIDSTQRPYDLNPLYANNATPLGSRYFVSSVLRNIFLKMDTASNNEIKEFNSILDETIMAKPNDFGGAPNLYSTRSFFDVPGNFCGQECTNEDQILLPMSAASTPARSAILSRACKKIIIENKYTNEALLKAGLSTDNPLALPFDESKIEPLYNLFYLGETMPDSLKKIISESVKKLNSANLPNSEQWRFVLITFCESGYWQKL